MQEEKIQKVFFNGSKWGENFLMGNQCYQMSEGVKVDKNWGKPIRSGKKEINIIFEKPNA
jgi:hypothetical protein